MAPLDTHPDAGQVTDTATVVVTSVAQLRAAVSAKLRMMQKGDWSDGYIGLEDMKAADVAKLPLMRQTRGGSMVPTIFATIATAMAEAGHEGEIKTVGDVAAGLTGRKDVDEAAALAHNLGCHCHEVTAAGAAGHIDQLN